MVHAFHQIDAGSERGKRLRHLDTHRPTAQDDDALRDLAQAGGLTVCPDSINLIKPRDRGNHRLGASGDHDVSRRVAVAGDLHCAAVDDPRDAPDQIDSVVSQPPRLGRVVVA